MSATTPAAPVAPAEGWCLWADIAARYAPFMPSPEEDVALAQASIAEAPVQTNLRVSQLLLSRVAEEPDRLFLPTLWVEEQVKALVAAEAQRRMAEAAQRHAPTVQAPEEDGADDAEDVDEIEDEEE